VLASGARFGAVLADAEYGKAAEFRAGLDERRLGYAAGILPTRKLVWGSRCQAFIAGTPVRYVALRSAAEL
jgi:SRSO17 transposase